MPDHDDEEGSLRLYQICTLAEGCLFSKTCEYGKERPTKLGGPFITICPFSSTTKIECVLITTYSK